MESEDYEFYKGLEFLAENQVRLLKFSSKNIFKKMS